MRHEFTQDAPVNIHW